VCRPAAASAFRCRCASVPILFKSGRLGLIGLKKLRPDGLIRLGRGGQSLADTVLLLGRQTDSILAADPRLNTFSPRGWGPVTFKPPPTVLILSTVRIVTITFRILKGRKGFSRGASFHGSLAAMAGMRWAHVLSTWTAGQFTALANQQSNGSGSAASSSKS
jgi:hypothetical protein